MAQRVSMLFDVRGPGGAVVLSNEQANAVVDCLAVVDAERATFIDEQRKDIADNDRFRRLARTYMDERDTYRAALIACRAESKWAGHGATVQGLALHAVGDIVEAAFVEVSK